MVTKTYLFSLKQLGRSKFVSRHTFYQLTRVPSFNWTTLWGLRNFFPPKTLRYQLGPKTWKTWKKVIFSYVVRGCLKQLESSKCIFRHTFPLLTRVPSFDNTSLRPYTNFSLQKRHVISWDQKHDKTWKNNFFPYLVRGCLKQLGSPKCIFRLLLRLLLLPLPLLLLLLLLLLTN